MLSYSERAKLCSNPTAIKLLNLMDQKQTNLSFSADCTNKSELLALADLLGPEICILKTHIDIVDDFDANLTNQLAKLAAKHNFLIFEDRKFAEIGNTAMLQYEHGIYKISAWADIVNAHTVSGPGIIEALKTVGEPLGRGLLLLAEMTPKGNLATGSYTNESIKMAEAYPDFVIGFITTKQLVDNPRFINLTPGVQLINGSDKFGQQYATPEQVIGKDKSDIIIVGRGIYQSSDQLTEAKKYRAVGWSAYQNRI